MLITAPGYADLRVAIALRPSELNLSIPFSSCPTISMRLGQAYALALSIRVNGSQTTVRAGANIGVDLVTDQPRIVSVNPAHVVLEGSQSSLKLATERTLARVDVPSDDCSGGLCRDGHATGDQRCAVVLRCEHQAGIG